MNLKPGTNLLKCILLVASTLAVMSCKSDDDLTGDNPFLIDPLVNITLNLSLPEYNSLNFPGGSVIIPPPQGIKGVVVYNVNNTQYTAFEISDPNHTPNSCSRMEIEGIEATCPCTTDDNVYNIVTGQHQTDETKFPMMMYRAVRSGNTLQISN